MANGWQSGEVVVVMLVVMWVAMATVVGVEDVGSDAPAMALSIPTPPAATQRRAHGRSRCGKIEICKSFRMVLFLGRLDHFPWCGRRSKKKRPHPINL